MKSSKDFLLWLESTSYILYIVESSYQWDSGEATTIFYGKKTINISLKIY